MIIEKTQQITPDLKITRRYFLEENKDWGGKIDDEFWIIKPGSEQTITGIAETFRIINGPDGFRVYHEVYQRISHPPYMILIKSAILYPSPSKI